MKKQGHYRQGDVLIAAITEIPAKAVKQPKAAKIILAHGTATGHHHMMITPKPVAWFTQGEIPSTTAKPSALAGEIYVKLPAGGTVKHQEHAEIVLPKGTYRIMRQREYSPEAIRNVAD